MAAKPKGTAPARPGFASRAVAPAAAPARAAAAPPPEPKSPPLAVLGAVLGCMAPLVLGLLFASAYDSLDRRAPDEDAARNLHMAVLMAGGVAIVGGVVVALRTKPLLALALLAFPLGFGLAGTATTYSETECVSGVWDSDCRTWGDQEGTLRMWAWLGFAMAAGGGAAMLLAGREWALGFALAVGMAAAAAYFTASLTLLPRLAEEAVRAAESNEPVIHDTPGLAPLLAVGAFVGAAMAWRRTRA